MEIDQEHCIVGTKQVLRCIAEGSLKRVVLAKDADAPLKERIRTACCKGGVRLSEAGSMAELGMAAGIDVNAACIGLTKDAGAQTPANAWDADA